MRGLATKDNDVNLKVAPERSLSLGMCQKREATKKERR